MSDVRRILSQLESGDPSAWGGRALTQELRAMTTDSTFCDTMQHLEAFVTNVASSTKTLLVGEDPKDFPLEPRLPSASVRSWLFSPLPKSARTCLFLGST